MRDHRRPSGHRRPGGLRQPAANQADRPPDATALRFRAVTAETRSDFESFFAARGAPHFCWCMVWRRTAEEAKHHTGPDRRRQMMTRLDAGTPIGLLAYDGDKPVGVGLDRPARNLPQSRRTAGRAG